MKKSTRLVLIDTKNNTYAVYEDRTMLAFYKLEGTELISKEEIEELRVASYSSKA